jgi:Antibiotic biosynthesis monooxygenase
MRMIIVACVLSLVQAGHVLAQAPAGPPAGWPDLVSGLKETPGCLGVETARTASGKNVIFAWFENREAVSRWYRSDMHRDAMRKFFPNVERRPPLENVPDDSGPLMVIASVTFSDKPQFQEAPGTPISQIAIEVYKPMTGGIYLGSRFAPDALQVPGSPAYTPKVKTGSKP